MLIPVEWLRDFVDLPEEPDALAERLTATGNEIEAIRTSPAGPVLSLKLTPNRADMLSIRGAAREVAALYDRPFRDVAFALDATGPPDASVRVEVEAPDLSPRYVARLIQGVRVGPSPAWLQGRIEAMGGRSISNVVDVTNYVMCEMGQPLHAFDLDRLAGRRIVVRRARPGERIVAIDGTQVALEPEMLVIADGARPVAVAGVMGGRETEVEEGTTAILLESAHFAPASVRRTSRRTGLTSPSSYRFERGVDPSGVLHAADRAAALIVELAGGRVSETLFDLYPEPARPRVIRFRPERCRALLGEEVPDAEAERLLRLLDLQVERESAVSWLVTAPTRRGDLQIEEDLIEEVGRLYGYDRLPETLPAGIAGAGRRSDPERLVMTVRDALTAQGLFEAVTNTLVSRAFLAKTRLERSPAWAAAGATEPVVLRNPLSADFDALRPSLLPGLLQAAQHNLRHGARDVLLFEAGYAHARPEPDGQPIDRLLAAGVMLGSRWSHTWNADRQSGVDFYAAKGAVEALAGALGTDGLGAERAEHGAFHPGRAAWLSAGGERLGIVGELHPAVAEALDLPRGVFAFELDGEALRLRSGARRYQPPGRFPSALRDLAVVVDRGVESARIEAILRAALGEWCRAVRLFDVYEGAPLPEGKVSLAYALEVGAADRTLTDEEVDGRLAAARERLAAEVGAAFRG